VINRSGRKKYQQKILKEELDPLFVVAVKDITTMRENTKIKMTLILLMSREKNQTMQI
jgi:hypothetical protein